MIHIFTDGAASGNPGPGGYGVVMRAGIHEKELSGGFRLTTNNRMELLAVIEGLKAIKKPGQPVTVFSDSKYVVDSVEKGWVFGWVKKGFKDKKNKDLWIQYLNLRCDRLAVAASQNKNALAIDIFFEAEKKNQTNLL